MFEAFGSDLLKGNTADYATATVWTSVGCVLDITPPNASVESIPVPPCLNGSSRAKRFLPGGADFGEASWTIAFASGKLQDAIDALGTEGSFRIKLGDSGRAIAFNGYFSGFSTPQLTENGFISVTATVKVSGEPAEVAVS